MNARTRISIALIASTLILAGCASSGPGLYVDSSLAKGKSPPVFSEKETPTISYYCSETSVSGVAIKIIMQPFGITVRRQYAAVSSSEGVSDSGFEIDHPTHFDPKPKREMEFPGLVPGNYTAELWIKGRKESSLDFSVTNSAGSGSFPRHVHLTGSSEIRVPLASARYFAARKSMNPAVAQLDAFVGLTDEQKTKITLFYLDEEAFARPRQIREKIHLLLSPEQQKLYDDDGWAGRAVEQLLGRLNESVGLTSEQTAGMAKIVAAEKPAPEEFSSIGASLDKTFVDRIALGESVRTEILALLTPAQRKIYEGARPRPGKAAGRDALPPHDALLRERVTDIGDLIKKSPAITARLGLITEVKPVWSTELTFEATRKSAGHPGFASGQFRYNVAGSERSEQLTVYWEKVSPTAPLAIVKIQSGTGEVVTEQLHL